MRGLAILAVLTWHAQTSHPPTPYQQFFGVLSLGPLGVRLFFVLSGFLITRTLLASFAQRESRWLTLRAFYWRRFLRLFPVYYLALALATWLGFDALREQPWWHWLYLSNVKFVLAQQFDRSLSPLWSLAVEEQFYLIWPITMLFMTSNGRIATIAIAIGVAVCSRWVLIAHGHEFAAYMLTFARLDAFALGGLVALTTPSPHIATRAALFGSAITLGIVGAEQFGFAGPAHGTLVEISSGVRDAGIVALVARGVGGTVLTFAPLVWLGQVSYCVYVVHRLVPEAIERMTGLAVPLTAAWIWAPVTLTIAALSWTLMERPLQRYRDAL